MKRYLIAACLVLAATPAWASCSVRPKAPEFVRPGSFHVPGEGHKVYFVYGYADHPYGIPMYFDVTIKMGSRQIFHAPGLGDGNIHSSAFTQWVEPAEAGTTYCAHVKARTERGTEGCVSSRETVACIKTPGLNRSMRRVMEQGRRRN